MSDIQAYISEQLQRGKNWIFIGFGLGYIRGLGQCLQLAKSNTLEELKDAITQKVKDMGSFRIEVDSDELGGVSAYLNILAGLEGEPLFPVTAELADISEHARNNFTVAVEEPVREEKIRGVRIAV